NLDGTTGGGSDNAGIFRGDGLSPLVPIFHKGAPAPNGNGSILGFSVPVLNAAGQAATRMVFTGTGGGTSDDRGIFRGGVLALPARIAREGQLAPDGNGRFDFLDLPALYASGQVAFAGVFTGTSGGISDNAGVYLGD